MAQRVDYGALADDLVAFKRYVDTADLFSHTMCEDARASAAGRARENGLRDALEKHPRMTDAHRAYFDAAAKAYRDGLQ